MYMNSVTTYLCSIGENLCQSVVKNVWYQTQFSVTLHLIKLGRMLNLSFSAPLKAIAVFYLLFIGFFFPKSIHAQFVKGADIGWLEQMEATGYKFYDSTGIQKE